MMMGEEGSEGEFFFSFWVFSGYEMLTGRVSGLGVFERRMELAEGEGGGGDIEQSGFSYFNGCSTLSLSLPHSFIPNPPPAPPHHQHPPPSPYTLHPARPNAG